MADVTNDVQLLLENVWATKVEIGIRKKDDGSWEYAELCEGIESFEEDVGSQNQQYFFMCLKGYADNEATGLAPQFTVSGRRVYGDPAQEYIWGLKYELGNSRKTSLRVSVTDPSGETPVTHTITCGATILDIVTIGGAATDNSPFNFTLALNGKPALVSAPQLLPLTVTSAAGEAGKTVLTVSPALTGGDKYMTKTAETVTLPAAGAVVTGWTEWDGTAPIAATGGQQIGVVEVSAQGAALKGGIATVVAGA